MSIQVKEDGSVLRHGTFKKHIGAGQWEGQACSGTEQGNLAKCEYNLNYQRDSKNKWPYEQFGTFLKTRNPLTSSATPKEWEDHRSVNRTKLSICDIRGF